jgi:dTDP-glucose pyrophosphorylase
MSIEIVSLKIKLRENLLTALKRMDDNRCKLLIISNEDGEYQGLLSIGDIQRALLNNVSLDNTVEKILRNDYVVANSKMSLEEIKKLMLKIRAEFMPVITLDNKIEKIYFWGELFEAVDEMPVNQFTLPIVIMAGGIGTRMRPLTNVLPKPLIPIGDKTMIEEIMDRFSIQGCNTFHISVNYKAEFIEYYLKEQNLPFHLNYFKEEKPMGTGGSLSLLKGKINETFFVSNCDILIDQDYSEVLKYHRENKNEITVIAAMKTYPIAYGTIETGENGKLLNMVEKPELTFKINSGMYILEPHLLDEMPENKFFHITQLIEEVNLRGGRVGVFPISEKSWIDIGNWEEYFKNYKHEK